MGKSKMKKRMSLQRQFVKSYVLVLLLSLFTALTAIFSFYYIYNHSNNFNPLNMREITKVLEYAHKNGSSITDKEHLRELAIIIDSGSFTYSIRDLENKVLYSSEVDYESENKGKAILRRFTNMRNNFAHTSSMNIPLEDKHTGTITHVLVIAYRSHLVLVDFFIPFICFVVFTLIFSRSFSRKIKKPINELMNAVEKIKERDLDFTLQKVQEDEIGDLTTAFEDLRANLKDSLIREWQLEQDRREMISAITHDMRTPLAIIQGHVEVLQDGLKLDHEKLDRYLDIIEQNSQRAKKLMEEMSSLAEIDSPGFGLNPSYIDFSSFIDYKINEIEVLASKKQVTVEAQQCDHRSENRQVLVDTARLSQVIDNIIGNSIRFTPQGGSIKFNVTIEDRRACFKVCDSGPGFSKKDLVNVFKKFYTGDPSRSVEKGHSGLGLYIAKSIIEKHGGRITASNSLEGGACMEFFVTF